MSEEAVFALVDGDAEPVAAADFRLDLEKEFATNGKEAAADTADAASPVFRNFIDLEGGVVDKSLDGGDDAFVGVSDADAAADGADFWFGEAGCQFADGVGVKDAVGVDGDDHIGGGEQQRIADRAGFAAVDGVAAYADADVGEVALGFEHPFVA